LPKLNVDCESCRKPVPTVNEYGADPTALRMAGVERS